jgi:hypothetical protein
MSYTQLVSEVVPPSSDNSGSHQWYLDFAKPNVGTLGIPCISAATAVRDDLLTVGLEFGEIRARPPQTGLTMVTPSIGTHSVDPVRGCSGTSGSSSCRCQSRVGITYGGRAAQRCKVAGVEEP